jgi:predicted transposase/invertase (TIGR01784 family)
MQFVDIKNDIAFRKIFGNEKKTVILISFLNAVLRLEGDRRIKAITIENPFQLPILLNMKASIIDVKAKDYLGNTFIIEMQVADVAGMDKRLLYYTSKEYSQQIVSGEQYTDLNPVIFIGIFDFNFTEGVDYYSHHAICNVKTQERIIKDMDFYFIELPKFQKEAKNLDNITDKWIYFIKEAENLKVVPENLNDEGLTEAYADANKNSWTLEALNAYDYAAMREQDQRGRLQKAEQKAAEKGMARGLEEGMAKGIAEGIAKGMEKGMEEKEIEAVLGLNRIGLEKEKIAEALNISVQRVLQIIENHQNGD